MYAISLHSEARLCVVRFRDQMTVVSGRTAMRSYLSHPGFDPTFRALWDTRGAQVEADFSGIFAAVTGMTSDLRRFTAPVLAVMLVRGAGQFGMARMLGQIVETVSNIHIEIAETEAEAARLLGLAGPDLAAILAAPEPLPED